MPPPEGGPLSELQDAIDTLLRPGVRHREADRARRALEADPQGSVPLLLHAIGQGVKRAHKGQLMAIVSYLAHEQPALAVAHAHSLARWLGDADVGTYALNPLRALPTPWPDMVTRQAIASLAENPWEAAFLVLARAGRRDAASLAPMLSSKQPLARGLALRALTRWADPETPALLREAAEHIDPRVRSAAWWGLCQRWALGTLPGPLLPRGWLREHLEPDPRLRAHWLRALGEAFRHSGDPWALDQARAALAEPDLPLLHEALIALRKIGAVGISEKRTSEIEARLHGLWLLGRDARAAEHRAALSAALGDPDPRLRVLALDGLERGLGGWTGPATRARLLPVGRQAKPLMLEDPSPEVRYRAWRVWRRSGLALEERGPYHGWGHGSYWPDEASQRVAGVLCVGKPGVRALTPHLRCAEATRRALAVKLLAHPVKPSPERQALLAFAARDPSRRVRVCVPRSA
ncbi:MAG: hypothetical protein H6741_02460 [Alphaproteobacteria bacterium]|nr:hypothetical protein [Alphaproteobacteria bacterium]MCB9791567.1 hypothetical protein [Alphaproteobacteria bacterium]